MTTLLHDLLRKDCSESPHKVSFNIREHNISYKMSEQLFEYIKSMDPQLQRPVVIVAIGTDRSTGDSLGPLVGSLLTEKQALIPEVDILGTLDNPVHAVNLADHAKSIFHKHINPIVIAVDASLGKSQNVGNINLGIGPLKPGAGVNKDLPSIGHIHFIGIVNVGGYLEYLVLQNTRLSLVMKLAKSISEALYKTSRKLHLEKLKAPSH
ncbi:MAG: spore protease YyaC [Bacillota bacterium]